MKTEEAADADYPFTIYAAVSSFASYFYLNKSAFAQDSLSKSLKGIRLYFLKYAQNLAFPACYIIVYAICVINSELSWNH